MPKRKIKDKNVGKEYREKLEGVSRVRYDEKIKICGVDPYTLDLEVQDNVVDYPNICDRDISNYFIHSKSLTSGEEVNVNKGHDADTYFYSGYVHPVSAIKTKTSSSRTILIAKVNRSMNFSKNPHHAWVLSDDYGCIICAHCTCMAGRGEYCSHVGALLHSVAYSVSRRLQLTESTETSCTSQLCAWVIPTVKDVPYLPIQDVDFTTPTAHRNELKGAPTKITKKGKRPRYTPTEEEMEKFCSEIFAANPSAAALITHPNFSKHFENKLNDLPQSLSKLLDPSLFNKNYSELLDLSHAIYALKSFSKEELTLIEQATTSQSKSKYWLQIRSGIITASNMKSCCCTDPYCPSISLIKKICYPLESTFSTKETSYGCKHEKDALMIYENFQKQHHKDFIIKKSGLHVHDIHQFIAATPDAIRICSCCGIGIVEVKCPYCIKDDEIIDLVNKKSSCLSLNNDSTVLSLNESHAYYYQVQTQLLCVNGAKFCDFVIWTSNQIYLEPILPNFTFQSQFIEKAKLFFDIAILPELTAQFFSRIGTNVPRPPLLQVAATSNKNIKFQKVCYCGDIERGVVIKCSNTSCPLKLFHLSCLRMKELPKTKKWVCPDCHKIAFRLKKSNKNESENNLGIQF